MPIRFRTIRSARACCHCERRSKEKSEDFAGDAHFTRAQPFRRCSRNGVYDRFSRANRSCAVDARRCADFRQRVFDRVEHRIPHRTERRDKGETGCRRSTDRSAASRRPRRESQAVVHVDRRRCRHVLVAAHWRWHRMRWREGACEGSLRNTSTWTGVRGGQSNSRRASYPPTATHQASAAASARRVDHRSRRFLLSSIVSNSSYCAVGCWSAPGAW